MLILELNRDIHQSMLVLPVSVMIVSMTMTAAVIVFV